MRLDSKSYKPRIEPHEPIERAQHFAIYFFSREASGCPQESDPVVCGT